MSEGDRIRSIGILLPSSGVYPDLGQSMVSGLEALGIRAEVAHRGRSGFLKHDALILAGQCRTVKGLPGLLRRSRSAGQLTILWQLEPLPPPTISDEGLRIGTRVAGFDWARLDPVSRGILNLLLPFRTATFRAIRARLARSYAEIVAASPDADGWIEYGSENLFNCMIEHRWISRAMRRGWIDSVATSTRPRAAFLNRQGIDAAVIPVGYDARWGVDQQIERDIDVLYLGRIKPEVLGGEVRDSGLVQLRDEMARRGRPLTLETGVYGAARDRLLSRARIVLCPLRVPHDLAGMRVLMGMACGAMVLSQTCPSTEDYVPGVHLVTAGFTEMADTIEYHLDHEAERERIARAGQRYVTEEMTMPQVLQAMLDRAVASSNHTTTTTADEVMP